MLSTPFLGRQRRRAAPGFSVPGNGHLISVIVRDPHVLVSRRLALTMTDVVAMLVVVVAIVAILF
jgi:hypothetical protein